MRLANKSIKLFLLTMVCAVALVTNASADAVSDWNTLSYQMSAANVPSRAPTQTSRIAAMTHIAIHDALNAIDSRYEQYAYTGSGDTGASPTAAIAAAAYNVLRLENPTQAGVLQTAYNNMLATVPDGPAKDAGIAIGEQSAAAVRANRSNDGSATAACSVHSRHRTRRMASDAARVCVFCNAVLGRGEAFYDEEWRPLASGFAAVFQPPAFELHP